MTSDMDDAGEPSPLLLHAIEAVTKEMARAFDVVWSRPDAPLLMEQFLAGELVFGIARDGLTIMAPDAVA
jgi:hypothetical protein